MTYANSSRKSYGKNQFNTESAGNADKLTRYLMTLKDKFESIAQGSQVSFDAEIIYAKDIMNNSDYFVRIASQNEKSLGNAMLKLAASGLTLDSSQKQAYLMPRDGRIILDVSYIGLSHMATNEGLCRDIVAELVFSKDEFISKGRRESPLHQFDPFAKKGDLILSDSDGGQTGERGEFRGAYVDYRMKDGGNLVFFIDREDLEAARSVSDSWKRADKRAWSPWATFPWKMILKSAIKQTIHFIPGNRSKISQIVHYLNEECGEGMAQPAGTIPCPAAVIEMASRTEAEAVNQEAVNQEAVNQEAVSQEAVSQEVVSQDVVSQQSGDTMMSEIPNVRLSAFKRISKLTERAKKTLAFETIIAEIAKAFEFNEAEINYGKKEIEKTRRAMLKDIISISLNISDFTEAFNFVNNLADSEFKEKSRQLVEKTQNEFKKMRQLFEYCRETGDYSAFCSAAENIKFDLMRRELLSWIPEIH